MGTKDKLIERLKQKPKDFTFNEAERLLTMLGYVKSNKGKTSGSRILFYKPDNLPVFLHRPHPQNTLKEYAVRQLITELIKNGDIL